MNFELFARLEFEPWYDDSFFLQQIQKLQNVNINDPEEVHAAIEVLEVFSKKFHSWLQEADTILDETDIDSIVNVYDRSVKILKNHEGVNLSKASDALRTCLRLTQLVFGLLYDGWKHFGGEMPTHIRELI